MNSSKHSMMRQVIEKFRGKRVLILGFGKEGQSTYQVLREHLPGQELFIADADPGRKELQESLGMTDVQWITGEGHMDQLDHYDLIVRSPGVLIPEALTKLVDRKRITSQTELLLEGYRDRIIGITGTKGKSTTSALIYHILHFNGRSDALLGNIGTPPLSLHIADDHSWIVFEMSSNQLEELDLSPRIAVLLNLYAEHLDRYKDVKEYWRAKGNIFRSQGTGDVLVYNGESAAIQDLASKRLMMSGAQGFGLSAGDNQCFASHGDVWLNTTGSPVKVLNADDSFQLKGSHNLANLLAAVLATSAAGLTPEEIAEAVPSFKGLKHRMQDLGILGGIHYYNDSIATIPEAAIHALHTLSPVYTLILGGYDRNLEYEELAQAVCAHPVRNVILTGPAGRRIHKLLLDKRFDGRLFFIERLEDAFPIIREHTPAGAICLLSPAAASYDQFRSFEARGELFIKKAGEFLPPA